MSEEKLLTIGRDETMRALNDEKFLSKFPMFRTIKSKSDVLKKSAGSGCSSCRQKRIAQNLTLDFLNVLKTLPKEDAVRIKEYFGAEKLMYTMLDKTTGTYRSAVV
jgi:hypothetical protein